MVGSRRSRSAGGVGSTSGLPSGPFGRGVAPSTHGSAPGGAGAVTGAAALAVVVSGLAGAPLSDALVGATTGPSAGPRSPDEHATKMALTRTAPRILSRRPHTTPASHET